MCLATMPSWISLVPPSIELALVRSQSRAALPSFDRSLSHSSASRAARGHHQLVAALVQLGAGIFHHRRAGGMRLAGLQLVDEALAHRREGHGVDVERGDVGAQQRIARASAPRRAPRAGRPPPRPMPLIISRSWPRRYLATSQPLFTSPTSWSLGTFTSSKKVSQKGE